MTYSTAQTVSLYKAILLLKSEDEAKRFCRDLLTKQEIEEFAKRWEVAQLLDQCVPYTEIVKKTNMSSTTIARVSKWLKKGQNGYRLILERLHRSHIPAKKGIS